MSFDLNEDCCTKCGVVGFSLAECAPCNYCTFCRQHGHLVTSCINAPVCNNCGRKDHHVLDCKELYLKPARELEKPLYPAAAEITPNLENINEDRFEATRVQQLDRYIKRNSADDTVSGSFDLELASQPESFPRKRKPSALKAGNNRKPRKIPRASTGPRIALNLSIQSFVHDDEELLNEQGSVGRPLNYEVTFPSSFRKIIKDIAATLWEDKNELLLACQYRQIIEEHGGVDRLADEAEGSIDAEIRELEGQPITVARLHEIRHRQNQPWPKDVGYLDYISDDSDKSYLRPYVGQTGNSRSRIVRQHGSAVRSGKNFSLHLYLIWRGNGLRRANFLRLWTIPDRIPKGQWRNTISSVLKLAFCFAFASLPRSILERYSNVTGRPDYVGANVMDPMLQMMRLHPMDTYFYRSQAQRSEDPEVKAFCDMRAAQRILLGTFGHGYINATIQDYKSAIKRTFSETEASAWLSSCKLPAVAPTGEVDYRRGVFEELSDIMRGSYTGLDFVPPAGSPSAKIGFVSDYVVSDETVSEEDSWPTLPSAYQELGFDESNSLAWTFDFCQRRELDPSSFRKLQEDSKRTKSITWCHKSLIQTSNLRVIFLCGPDAEIYVTRALDNLVKAKLKLRDKTYRVFLVPDPGSQRYRLYIRCPDLVVSADNFLSGEISSLGDILKFAAMMTETKGARPYHLECALALRYILAQYSHDKRCHGGTMSERTRSYETTSNNLARGMKMWLKRRGFSVADVSRCRELAGSTTTGLLLLVDCVRKRIKKMHHDAPHSTGSNPLFIDNNGIDLAVEELFIDNPGLQDGAAAKIATLAEDVYKMTLSAFRAESRKDMVMLEHNEMLSMSLVHCPCTANGASFLEQLEQRGQFDSTGIRVDTSQVLADSACLQSLYLPAASHQHRVVKWRYETEAYKTRGYNRSVFSVNDGASFAVQMDYVRLVLSPKTFDTGRFDDKVTVYIEVSEPGVRHCKAFALNAAMEDPASRVAFRIVAKDRNDGSLMSFYPASSGETTTIYAVNTLADKILEGTDSRILALRPRRYLRAKALLAAERASKGQ